MTIVNLVGLFLGFLGTIILALWGVPPIPYNRNGTISMMPLNAPQDSDGTNYTYIRRKYFQFYYGYRIGLTLIALGFIFQSLPIVAKFVGYSGN